MSTTRKTLSIFWQATNRYSLLFWVGTFGAVIAVIVQDIIPPFIVSKAFTQLQRDYNHGQQLHFSDYSKYFWVYLAAMFLGAAIWRVQGYSVWIYEIRTKRDLALQVFTHLQSQSQRFYDDRFAGALVSQTNKFLSAYERLMDEFIWSVVSGLTALVVSLGVLFFVSYIYALILMIITLTYMNIMYRQMKRQLPYNHDEALKETRQTAALADVVSNVSNVRAFAGEDYELKRFSEVVNNVYKSSHTLSAKVFKTESISHAQTNTFHIVAFLFGLIAITSLNANVGVLYLALTYTGAVTNRLWQFGRIMRNINRSFGDAAEMTEILQIEPEVKDAAETLPLKIHQGQIEFKDVLFRYPENKKNDSLFKNFGLVVKPGEKVGLVGHSGGGKTTVTRLILRFMDIEDGQILIDGQDIKQLAQQDLRHSIAYVSQEPMLFHRSLLDNIRYGRPEASEEEVYATAKMANIHEFITQRIAGGQRDLRQTLGPPVRRLH
jgi:ATP-binding cassette subfamily B protein